MKIGKRILAFLLTFLMAFGALGVSAFAEDGGAADAAPTFEKVTDASQLTSGQYVVVCDNGKALEVFDNNKNAWVTAVDVSEDNIADGPKWTLGFSGGTVTLTDGNGTQIAPPTNDKNAILSGTYAWAYSFQDGKIQFTGEGRVLAYNAGSNGFRAYNIGSAYPQWFALYKETTAVDPGPDPDPEPTPTPTVSPDPTPTEGTPVTVTLDVYNVNETELKDMLSGLIITGDLASFDNRDWGTYFDDGMTLKGSDASYSKVEEDVFRVSFTFKLDNDTLNDIKENGDKGGRHEVNIYLSNSSVSGWDTAGDKVIYKPDSKTTANNRPGFNSSRAIIQIFDGENILNPHLGDFTYAAVGAPTYTIEFKYVDDVEGKTLKNSSSKQIHVAGAPYDASSSEYMPATIKGSLTGNKNYALEEPDRDLTGRMPAENIVITGTYSLDEYNPATDGTYRNPDGIPDKNQSYPQDFYVDFFYLTEDDVDLVNYKRSFETENGFEFTLDAANYRTVEYYDHASPTMPIQGRLRMHWIVEIPLVDKWTTRQVVAGAAGETVNSLEVSGSVDKGTTLPPSGAGALYTNHDPLCLETLTCYAVNYFLADPVEGGVITGATPRGDSEYSYQYVTPHEEESAEKYLPVEVTATANEGYVFKGWKDQSGKTVSTEPTFTFSLENLGIDRHVKATYTAVFEQEGVFTATVEQEGWTEYGEVPAPKATVEGPGAEGYGEPVIEYSADGETWTEEVPVEAGTYYIRATWAAVGELPELSAQSTFTIAPHDHKLVKVEAKKATCTEDGCNEHWTCKGCGKYYDKDGNELKAEDVILKALGHDWGEWSTVTDATNSASGVRQRTCKRCDAVEKQTIPAKNPVATGDENNMTLWIVLMVVALVAVAGGAGYYFLVYKKKNSK